MTGEQRPEDARTEEFVPEDRGWDPGDETVAVPTQPDAGDPADREASDPEASDPTADPGSAGGGATAVGPEGTAVLPPEDGVAPTGAPETDPTFVTSEQPLDLDPAAAPLAAAGTAGAAGAVGSAGVADAAGEPEAPRRRRTGLINGLAVLLVALIAGGWFWWDATSRAQREEAIRTTATTYLDALAASDAAGALATLAEQPATTTLLTDEVLAASNAVSPISEIAVGEVTSQGSDASADVSYRIGDESVQITLPMTGDGRTSWHLTNGLGELTTTATEHLTVNGVELTEATNPVFPGAYTAEATNQYLTLNGTTSALVSSPEAAAGELAPEYAISDTGNEAILNTVRARFDECVASTETLPANCPFGVAPEEGYDVEEGSVRFAVTNDPWAGFAPALDAATMTASGAIHMEMTASATVAANGLTGAVSFPFSADRNWAVDLTQDPLVVVWS